MSTDDNGSMTAIASVVLEAEHAQETARCADCCEARQRHRRLIDALEARVRALEPFTNATTLNPRRKPAR